MHSSRIRTVHCSGGLGGGGVCQGGVCLRRCLPRGGCLPRTHRQTPPPWTHSPPPNAQRQTPPPTHKQTPPSRTHRQTPPVPRGNPPADPEVDIPLWTESQTSVKHYLSTTTVANGKNCYILSMCILDIMSGLGANGIAFNALVPKQI